MTRSLSRKILSAGCAALLLGACDTGLSDLATFIDSPFGKISDNVKDLDKPGVEGLMNELMRRFNAYLALRDAVPFEAIAPDACIENATSTDTRIEFTTTIECMLGGSATPPLAGTLGVVQAQVASTPVGVFKFDLDYQAVQVGALTVDGSEKITETQGSDGASVRTLKLTQDGEEFDYEFRAGLVDGETPVFDYQLSGPDGDVIARISNPASAGGFVTVSFTGLDGTLSCEVRAADPARSPRGTCDNGVVFGLPQ
ncbi:MAG: hypothetical protein U1F43_18360 [Myxococcota bacterium]